MTSLVALMTLGQVMFSGDGGAGTYVKTIKCLGSSRCYPVGTIGFIDVGDGGALPGASFAPGPPPFSIQYNCPDGGGFCGATYALIDGGFIVYVPVAAHPAAPALEGLLNYGFQEGAGMPGRPMNIDSTMGLAMPAGLLNEIRLLDSSASWAVSASRPYGFGTGNVFEDNPPSNGSATVIGGTGGNAWAQGAGWMNLKRRIQNGPTAAAINTSAGFRWSTVFMWPGNCAGCGGFIWSYRAGFLAASSGMRVFWGVYGTTGIPTATVDPSTFVDTFYVGADAADTNLGCCSNSAAGAATCQTLGASYPKNLVDAGYDVVLAVPPNSSNAYCAVYSWPTRTWTVKTLSTDLPTNTVQLGWLTYVNTGTSATPVGQSWMDVTSIYNMGP